MSTYDDSSLFLYPSGYKASVLFAQKPMDANGQLAFTRSNDTATRVASNGLIEKVRTNVVTYSQDFSDASWTKTAITISTSATANPVNGALTAQDAIPTATLSAHRIFKLAGVVSTPNTWSIYAKAKGYNFITIVENGNTSANVCFNLSTGAISSQNSAVGQIQSLGNGWYRCSMIHTTLTSPRFDVYVSPTDSISAYTADGTSGVTLFGAQAEASDFGPTPYIPTVAAAVSVGPLANIPRIDYLGGGCGKLLLEPQRTNLVTFSESFDNAAWGKTASVVTANVSVSPDGYQNADRVTDTNVLSGHVVQQSALNVASSAIVSASVYLKKDVSRYAGFRLFVPTNGTDVGRFSIVVDLETGAVTSTLTSGAAIANLSYSVVNAGNGWYRAIISGTSPVGNCGLMVWLTPSATPTNDGFATTAFTGNGQSVFCWGAQFEVGSYATSYIPTLAASVTRGADACSKTGISSLIGQTEGTLFAEFSVPVNENVTRSIGVNDGTISNRVIISTFATSLFVRVDSGGVNQVNSSATIVPTAINKVAFRYKANDFAAYVNGVKVITDTSGSTFSGTTLSSFSFIQPDGTSPFNGVVKQILFFKTGLSDSDLASLTA